MDLTVKGTQFHNPWKIFLVAFINHEASIFVLDDIKQLGFISMQSLKKSIKQIA